MPVGFVMETHALLRKLSSFLSSFCPCCLHLWRGDYVHLCSRYGLELSIAYLEARSLFSEKYYVYIHLPVKINYQVSTIS